MTPFNINPVLARQMFVYEHAKLTVWIRQRSDNKWEAIDWYGKVMAESNSRADIDLQVKALANNAGNNIYAIAFITPPGRRRKHYSKPTRRVV